MESGNAVAITYLASVGLTDGIHKLKEPQNWIYWIWVSTDKNVDNRAQTEDN